MKDFNKILLLFLILPLLRVTLKKNSENSIRKHSPFRVILMIITVLFSTFSFAKEKKERSVKVNLFDNQILDTNIRTVEFYLSGGTGDVIDFPMKPLNSTNPLVLEFDWMGAVVPYMNARILHCNYDWERSALVEIDFIPDINEYQLNDIEQSSNTFVTYTHTRFEVPNVKKTGNYILQIYDQDDNSKVYLTRKFVVYDNKLMLNTKIAYSSVVKDRFTDHQINFSIQYGNMNIPNPSNAIKVAILQNGRWDNALFDLIPTNVRLDEKLLEYNYFTGENSFKAGTEFRAFDMKSNLNERLGVEKFEYNTIPKGVILYKDKPLKNYAYTQNIDANGKFVISNLTGNNNTNSDYFNVEFRLEIPKKEESIYVFGGLSDWKMKDQFKLEYDSNDNIYKKNILLKQGYYNYLYAINEDNVANTEILEGSFQQTQNNYIMLVYYEEFGTFFDQIIGYKIFNE